MTPLVRTGGFWSAPSGIFEEAGIRQLLDIGTGLPTVNNTHQVAQATAPECRIVYVDIDPLVLVHARALLTSTPEGITDYLHADVRDPERILHEAARTQDFTRPVALMLLGIINYIMDNVEAHAIVNRLLDALPSGSYPAMSHPTAEIHAKAQERSIQHYNTSGAAPIRIRNRQELTKFFDGLELLEPGVVSCSLWRPDPSNFGTHAEVTQYCGSDENLDRPSRIVHVSVSEEEAPTLGAAVRNRGSNRIGAW